MVDSKLVNCSSVPHVGEPPKFSLLFIGLDVPSIQGSETSYLARLGLSLAIRQESLKVLKILKV